MGKILSVVSKRARNFNVENRAEKVISRDKPIRAPLHKSSLKEIDIIKKEDVHAFDTLNSKDIHLNENLKQVYVVSHDTPASNVKNTYGKPSEKRRLPLTRESKEETDMGYTEPETIPLGRITLIQGMTLISDYQEQLESTKDTSSLESAKKVAGQYKLELEDTVNILKYFSSFNIQMPERMPAKLSGRDKFFKMLQPQTKVIDQISPLKADPVAGKLSGEK